VRVTLYTDVGARRKLGEPTGPAGIGAVLRSESGEILGEIAKPNGRATNNVAEYTALIEGLEMALNAGITEIDAFIDSPVAGPLLDLVARARAPRDEPLCRHARQSGVDTAINQGQVAIDLIDHTVSPGAEPDIWKGRHNVHTIIFNRAEQKQLAVINGALWPPVGAVIELGNP
jgi:ribonuclease HI